MIGRGLGGEMLINIVQSFLPWILYFSLLGPTQSQMSMALGVAAVTSIVFELNALKKGFVLSWGTLIFFIFMLVVVVILKSQLAVKYAWVISHTGLAFIAWTSILLRRPFTIQYAKARVSKDKWGHSLFLEINYILTSIWGVVFLLGLGLSILRLYNPEFSGWSFELISYLPSIFGVWVTTWFPDWYREKNKIKKRLTL